LWLFHADRGSQYASSDYQTALQNAEIQCSMKRRTNCWDNAVIESLSLVQFEEQYWLSLNQFVVA
jgi:transposase InsO family protein